MSDQIQTIAFKWHHRSREFDVSRRAECCFEAHQRIMPVVHRDIGIVDGTRNSWYNHASWNHRQNVNECVAALIDMPKKKILGDEGIVNDHPPSPEHLECLKTDWWREL
jgi:hypothetical protein